MSYYDVGKDAKRLGRVRPSDGRKTDPEPERATPAAKPHRRVAKPYGYSYEVKWLWERKWHRQFQWFETERARDQSLAAFRRKAEKWGWYRDLRPESESAP